MRSLYASNAASLVAFSCECGHVWLELSNLIPGNGKEGSTDARRYCSKCGVADKSASGCFLFLKDLKDAEPA
jgi:hypothetical protein